MVLLWVLRGLPMVLLFRKWSVTLYYCICCNLVLIISHKYSTRCSPCFTEINLYKFQVYVFLGYPNPLFQSFSEGKLLRWSAFGSLFQEAHRFLLLFCKHLVDHLVDVQGIGVSVSRGEGRSREDPSDWLGSWMGSFLFFRTIPSWFVKSCLAIYWIHFLVVCGFLFSCFCCLALLRIFWALGPLLNLSQTETPHKPRHSGHSRPSLPMHKRR